jgi:hypothetical protein
MVWFSGVIPPIVFIFLGYRKGQLELLLTLGVEIHVGNYLRKWKFAPSITVYFFSFVIRSQQKRSI